MRELSEDRPIYIQIKEYIEDEILAGNLPPDAQIPSTNQLVNYFSINPVTVLKGVNLLTEEGIVYKKRGVGMFVHKDALNILKKMRQETFLDEYVKPLIRRAKPLGLTKEEMLESINQVWEEI